MAKVYLIPNKGVLVPKPTTGYLLPEGELVDMEIYWQRIINDGDAVIGQPPASTGSGQAPSKAAPATATTATV